jgi:hypothetical protein
LSDEDWQSGCRPYRATLKKTRTPAKDYYSPTISRIPVRIQVDDDVFFPSFCERDGSCRVAANIPSGSLSIPRGGSAIVDCGFTVEIPAGYRCRVVSSIDGLLVDLVDSKKFKLNIVNLGGDTNLMHMSEVGRIFIEPIYLFEWAIKG